MKYLKKGTYIEYLSVNDDTLYNLEDFCLSFDLDYKEILKRIKYNYLKIRFAKNRKYKIYITPAVLHCIVENNREAPKYHFMNDFSKTIGMGEERYRGEFPDRSWYDLANHRIILHYQTCNSL